MSKANRRMIQQLQVQLQIAMNESNRQRSLAAQREAAYNNQISQLNSQTQSIIAANQENVDKITSQFAAQIAATEAATSETIAGLEALLTDQQAASAAQAAQFAEQSAIAEERYNAQLTRQARIDSAYVPQNQPVASAPLVGDQRKPKTGTRTNTLSNLSIVSNPGGNDFRGQGNTQLAGLQIA